MLARLDALSTAGDTGAGAGSAESKLEAEGGTEAAAGAARGANLVIASSSLLPSANTNRAKR